MSKIFVVGDVHQNHEAVELFLKDWNGPAILLGDYFDQFYDTPEDAANTARWLKNSLKQPNRIHLMGNHDFHYRIPLESGTFCSGYSPEKHQVISKILSREDWNKIKYFHAENNCWFSHAGVSHKWFSHPVLGINQEVVEHVIAKAQEDIEAQIYHSSNVGALWAADFYRGGHHDKGGILWCDWRCMDFFPGITQIVGHTPREEVKVNCRKGGTNINVDTHLKECIIIDTETGNFERISQK